MHGEWQGSGQRVQSNRGDIALLKAMGAAPPGEVACCEVAVNFYQTAWYCMPQDTSAGMELSCCLPDLASCTS
jgi:hypothetical protein